MPDSPASWSWWFFTAIILAVGINIASHYLIPFVDKYWIKWSTSRQLKNEKKLQEFEENVSKLLGDSMEVLREEHVYTRMLLRFFAIAAFTVLSWYISLNQVELIQYLFFAITLYGLSKLLAVRKQCDFSSRLLTQYNERMKALKANLNNEPPAVSN